MSGKYYLRFEKICYGIFIGEKNKHPIDDTHPFIFRDANKCIKCGRCVRICAEVQGPGVLGYIFRGFVSYVAPEFDESLMNTACESCGKCIEVCPVGALVPKNRNVKLNPDVTEKTVQNCGLCGTGCKIEVNIQSGDITTITTPSEIGFNDRNLCFDGRFGWQGYYDSERVLNAYIRRDKENEWKSKESPWIKLKSYSDASNVIIENIKKANSKKIYVSPSSTNEEILLMKAIAEKIGAQISSLTYEKNFLEPVLLSNMMNKTYEDLQKAETIVVVGSISGVLRNLIRSEQRKGKKLIVITQDSSSFNQFSDELFDTESILAILEKIIESYYEEEDSETSKNNHPEIKNVITEQIELEIPSKTLFIYDNEKVSEEIIWNIWWLATTVCDFKDGSGVLPTSQFNNSRGLLKMGIGSANSLKSDFAILYGELPTQEQLKWIKKSDFVVSVNTHFDANDSSNVIFPQAPYTEIEGSAIANDGRITEFHNPLKSDIFPKILRFFADIDLIDKSQDNSKYWKNAVKDYLDMKQVKKEFTLETLADYIYSIENAKDYHPRFHSIQKVILQNMKRLTKESS
ncbi:MAG: 4Fe-4S binding protein [Candidatus Cloacimonetes bacterium]|nr:4Fe-4S binding protein [Candidatus Cloacimonadota bacterium]